MWATLEARVPVVGDVPLRRDAVAAVRRDGAVDAPGRQAARRSHRRLRTRRRVRTASGSGAMFRVDPNGLDVQRFTDGVARQDLPPGRRLLFVGRLDERKGFPDRGRGRSPGSRRARGRRPDRGGRGPSAPRGRRAPRRGAQPRAHARRRAPTRTSRRSARPATSTWGRRSGGESLRDRARRGDGGGAPGGRERHPGLRRGGPSDGRGRSGGPAAGRRSARRGGRPGSSTNRTWPRVWRAAGRARASDLRLVDRRSERIEGAYADALSDGASATIGPDGLLDRPGGRRGGARCGRCSRTTGS